ncbi:MULTISPECIES: restriction endonuclease subunit S [Gammaproteobacteria]|uniref:restriction endonuclease subunit S n=1 Tax=Gammaproteobacteria TaxID=1236 RepID=UPI001912E7F2|nr:MULTISPECIES: restriction endonuclease subunit S [Gammaproteobacteria]MBK5303798.1 restriction endonuclease subunit S [Bacillus sp. TH86]MBK5323567.1 restriction endonuclease subunit S [Bacillus sp. TH59]MBK5338517.1 restriction endonuclease subunit S [Bacillus sp. TH57]MBK5312572.1 restriction endonuclease subunit S [Pseudomonas sp. TH71]MBK5318065.1 restriction endonuclease subunit S [Erwinia sp. TH79]
MSKLPEGWTECLLEDLLASLDDGKILHQGWSPQCEGVPAPNGEWGVLKTTAVQDGYFLEFENKKLPMHLQSKPELEVKAGDLLMTCAGPRNRCGVICHVLNVREKLIFSGKIYRFRPDPKFVDPKFLSYLLRTSELKEKIDGIKTGISDSGMNMTRERFFSLNVRLAPVNEQARIAHKLDELLAQVVTLKSRLDAIPLMLKRFRQSVLAAAVSGHLTEDWDRVHSASPDIVLNTKAHGVRHDELESAEQILGKPLPEFWPKYALEQLVDPIRGIPYGIVQTGSAVEQGVPTVRCGDVKKLFVDTSNLKVVSIEIEREYQRTRLKGGEVLLAIRGSVGNVSVAPQSLRGCNISREVAMIPTLNSVVPFYLACLLQSPIGQQLLVGKVRGVAQKGINLADVRRLIVALPPFEEQIEIVRRVEQLFAFADQLEAKVASAKARVDLLAQSILAKAFCGELVPQDPNDEPASVLLERIRTQRAGQPKVRRGRKSVEVS